MWYQIITGTLLPGVLAPGSWADSGYPGWKRSIHLTLMRSANQLLDFPLVEIATKESPGHSLCQSWIHWCYVLRHQATKRPSFPEEATPRGILTSLPGRVSACWLGWRDGGLLTRSLGVFFNRRHFVTLRAGPSSSPFWKHRCFFWA